MTLKFSNLLNSKSSFLPIKLASLSLFLCLSFAKAHSETVIDLAQTEGPITHCASGFLWSISSDSPSDKLLNPLKIKKYRSRLTPWIKGTGIKSFKRLVDMGTTIQVCLSDEYALLYFHLFDKSKKYNDFGYHWVNRWPGDNGNYQQWKNVVIKSFNRIKEEGLKVEWDVWEEPNWKGWWGRSRQQFFETYAITYKTLKSLDPDAVIVGPSINKYDEDYLKDFLQFAKKNNIVPDLLSWHEIIEEHRPSIIPSHVQAMRDYCHQENIPIKGIDINEYCSPNRQTSPGLNAMYLINLERAQVNASCRACWLDESKNVFNGYQIMLDGLLTPKQQPRSTYWTYKAYGDLSGQKAKVSCAKGLDGLVTIGSNNKSVHGLFGHHEFKVKDKRISIRNLNNIPGLVKNNKVHISVYSIPNTEWAPLQTPIKKINKSMSLKNGRLDFVCEWLKPNEAFSFKITSPSN